MELFPTPTADDNEVRYCFFLASTQTQAGLHEVAVEQCRNFMAYAAQQTQGFLWHRHRFHLEVVETKGGRYILSGHTSVGDAIQDEWVVAKLVFDITRKFPGVVGRLVDSDGEFLLIESAEALPAWVTPESSDRRTFVVDGKLHIAPRAAVKTRDRETDLYDEDALVQVLDIHVETEASAAVQRLIRHKLDQVPTYVRDNIHRVRCLLPAKVAQVLSANHELVGPAVEAFYYREPKMTGLKCHHMATFLPPGDAVVEQQITFSRAQFAQLKQQQFFPPKPFLRHCTRYHILEANRQEMTHPDFQAADLGVKLACGLELLAAGDCIDQFQRPWKAQIHKTLQHVQDRTKFPVRTLEPDDDDAWLYVHPDTLEAKLERIAATDAGATSSVDELQHMAEMFSTFVQDLSSVEGVEGGTAPVQFDPEAFLKLLGGNEAHCANADLSAPWGEHSMDDDESSQSDSEESALDEAMAAMEAELAQTTVGQSFARLEALDDADETTPSFQKASRGSSSSNSSVQPLDIDFNLLSNLLESVASQEGHAGPVSNMVSQMDYPRT